MEYAKAMDTGMNALVFPALRRELGRKAPLQRETRVDGRPLDLGKPVPHQTLGVIQNLLEHEPIVTQGLAPLFPHDWRWLVGQLPAQLETLAALRNPAAHSKVLERDPAVELRNGVLGVGAEGLVVQFARARMWRER